MPRARTIAAVTGIGAAGALLSIGAVAAAGASLPTAAPPTAALTPPPDAHSQYTDQALVNVTVPANSYFTPGAIINILECADPGGLAANLPRDESSCDALTIQPDTIFVRPDGSIQYGPQTRGGGSGFTIYKLPALTLAEKPDQTPRCDGSDWCVLFIGEDQKDFGQPHIFSSPFLVTTPDTGVPEAPLPVLIPIVAVACAGGAYLYRRRRRRQPAGEGGQEM